MANIKEMFSDTQQAEIVAAVKEAELNTSGEIKVHIESKCKQEVMDKASYIFEKLKMHDTELRNGVLFYLATTDQKFAILGDAGINKKVAEDFWDNIKSHMLNLFKEGEFSKGLSEGIKMAGEQLKQHFPYQSDDVNELTDEISFGS